MSPTNDELLGLLDTMLLAREGDRREGILFRQGKGHFQLPGEGHEAIAAFALALRPDDYLFPGYRDRALVHARGLSIDALARDFLCREGGMTGGRNLPGHVSDRARNIFSITSPVGAQCLPAVGAAWGIQRRGGDQVVVCSIGDAATRQGEFYEAVCFALERSLPIVFVVEDNGYGISTPTAGRLPFDLGVFPAERTRTIDGRRVCEVGKTAHALVAAARRGEGPSLCVCKVDRLTPHTLSDDQRIYRDADDLARILTADPVERLAEDLIDDGVLTPLDFERRRAEIQECVRQAYADAEALPSAAPPAVAHVLGPVPAIPDPELEIAEDELSMLQATQRILRHGLRRFPEMVVFGEDVEDPKGGVFGLTKGLSRDFPGRVVNAPLAEATIAGLAGGLAATGHRPVFEFQFIDFIGPAFNQILGQLSNLRWRTLGDWTCPAVFYAPCGAYLPSGGMWHSQSGEGFLAHIPGLRVVMPSTPQETLRAFWSAFHCDDPTFVLLPKHLFHARQARQPWETPQVGRGRRVRSGAAVTVVAWGNTVEIALAAAEKSGVSADVLDLGWLIPWDRELIAESLARTGRLAIVQEDTVTGSVGASILADVLSNPDDFYRLRATPRLISRPDTHMPFSAAQERALLPDADSLAATLAAMVAE